MCGFPGARAGVHFPAPSHQDAGAGPEPDQAHSREPERRSRHLSLTRVPIRASRGALAKVALYPDARPPASLPSGIYRTALRETERLPRAEPLVRFPGAARSELSWRPREAPWHAARQL